MVVSSSVVMMLSLFAVATHSARRIVIGRPQRSPFLVRGGGNAPSFSTTAEFLIEKRRVYVAVGSNLGNRFNNIADGVDRLCYQEDIKLIRTSSLLETVPMYVTDQPAFLNGVIEVETALPPRELLARIKEVEGDLGRDFNGTRNGPRPLDLDILFYGMEQEISLVLNDPDLVIPHPRIPEREFVLAPLVDMGISQSVHPSLNQTIGSLFEELQENPAAIRVLPLPRGRMLYLNETIVMGILNVTPDSFSDGGGYRGQVDLAVKQALAMVEDGAKIIDIGGESTRPGAKEVAIEEELQRTIPVIEGIRKQSDVALSIDTRHSAVARAAIKAGADIVNDVSGGTFDDEMLSTVTELRVPMVIMHMRGTPEIMQSLTEYDNIVEEVVASLKSLSLAAENAGIQRWQQVLDPGIGFAKDLTGNLKLLKHYCHLQSSIGDLPLLLGTSRKGFIGTLTGETDATERDFGTVASCVAAICLGGTSAGGFNILRVHNVKGAKQGTVVMDAIKQVKD